mmetsp:Transcript_35075/g.82028  ORF Transcript_35075/g.82028 Transcript_35075/m.82028 type:complete len:654 (-) Transcript_35075:290-2251(-)|eukprot:CAMPEP_0178402508 /NCGR_PEP_ID=MMETSP0689_2-20121128/16879_1 /TAXON_ID=160604 /ORGANISM="Amphidinium massartii, Strain CS-259" /LENGTH=653 /DNA_ID=CAMNT_0020023413 /DNA_START=64 /DNA_END=2025 /DNA_ORIENTATION=-
MTPGLVLAIDQGTTSTRAILFDKDGNLKGVHQEEFPQYYPQAGWTEHDPKEILASCISCSEQALKKANASKGDVAAIGVTNQRETTVAWDKITGEPLHKAIVWLDLRTGETVEKLTKAKGGQDRFRKKTGLPVSTYFSATKIRWLLDNVPEVKAAADAERLAVGTIESWLLYSLTGGKDGGVHVTDITNASRYMLMNIQTCEWDENVCKTIGVPMHILPQIKSSSEVYGHVKLPGALEGLPISGALGDQHAALLGQGCLEVGGSKNTYGTGCFMLLNTGLDLVHSKSGLLTTVGFKLGPEAKTVYALEGSVACAGRTVQWLRDNLQIIEKSSDVEKLAAAVEDTGGVTFVPAFSGLFAPHWRTDARGVAVGMTLFTKREHICRAALESVAFQTVDIMQAMKKDTGLKLQTMRVDGGMTVNNLLMQMQADLLGISVSRAKMPEATALGAALAAGLAVGFYDKPEAVKEILEKAGGFEKFLPQLSPKDRSYRHSQWHDALGRSHNLSHWTDEKDEAKAKTLKKPSFKSIASIKPEQKGLNLSVKVVKLPDVVAGEVNHDVLCGDSTGVAVFHLTPAQFLPCEVGSYIKVQNGRAVMEKGFIRITVDKWGKVSQHTPASTFDVDESKNISSVEYELTSSRPQVGRSQVQTVRRPTV